MIGIEQIAEKAVSYDLETEWSEDADFKGIVQCAFMDGAKWMREKSVNSLWHNASEEPKEDSDVLIEYTKGGVNLFHWNQFNRVSPNLRNHWTLDIKRWLYIDDLLTKE